MEKQTTINLAQDEIEQRLKGVLDSAFKDGMLTRNGGHQLLHRIMCSLKGDDPESLTFAELTSYIPAPECTIPDKPTVTIPRNVQRHEDMSPNGMMRLFLQEDGDVVIEVAGREECGEREKATAEFCAGGGGGRSPRTVEALKLLMAAMRADNDAGAGSRDYERKYAFDLRPEDQDWSK